MNQERDSNHCPLDCPNRQIKQLGKGYSYLFAFALTAILASQAIGFRASKKDGWAFENHEMSPWILIPCCLLIAGALGVNTDPLAEALGKWLSRDK